mmetsp:Transcript_36654/g.118216  ORF Transcript_36654/g.118216 Transcript_36654/m.118216 type:complete len:696 (-) Transcript_36654:2697-4784(-)
MSRTRPSPPPTHGGGVGSRRISSIASVATPRSRRALQCSSCNAARAASRLPPPAPEPVAAPEEGSSGVAAQAVLVFGADRSGATPLAVGTAEGGEKCAPPPSCGCAGKGTRAAARARAARAVKDAARSTEPTRGSRQRSVDKPRARPSPPPPPPPPPPTPPPPLASRDAAAVLLRCAVAAMAARAASAAFSASGGGGSTMLRRLELAGSIAASSASAGSSTLRPLRSRDVSAVCSAAASASRRSETRPHVSPLPRSPFPPTERERKSGQPRSSCANGAPVSAEAAFPQPKTFPATPSDRRLSETSMCCSAPCDAQSDATAATPASPSAESRNSSAVRRESCAPFESGKPCASAGETPSAMWLPERSSPIADPARAGPPSTAARSVPTIAEFMPVEARPRARRCGAFEPICARRSAESASSLLPVNISVTSRSIRRGDAARAPSTRLQSRPQCARSRCSRARSVVSCAGSSRDKPLALLPARLRLRSPSRDASVPNSAVSSPTAPDGSEPPLSSIDASGSGAAAIASSRRLAAASSTAPVRAKPRCFRRARALGRTSASVSVAREACRSATAASTESDSTFGEKRSAVAHASMASRGMTTAGMPPSSALSMRPPPSGLSLIMSSRSLVASERSPAHGPSRISAVTAEQAAAPSTARVSTRRARASALVLPSSARPGASSSASPPFATAASPSAAGD